MRKLIVITGPQGSGNHMISSLLHANSDTIGWDGSQDHNYEPFYECWQNPQLLHEYLWTDGIHFTNMSCPFITDDGSVIVPNIVSFLENAKLYTDVQLAVIARDKNILEQQNARLGREYMADTLSDQLQDLNEDIVFISHESIELYGNTYWNTVERALGLPLTDIEHLLTNSNKKYIQSPSVLWNKLRGDDWPCWQDFYNGATISHAVESDILTNFARLYNIHSIEELRNR